MEKTKEQVLKSKYGLAKGSYKYIPAGSEILKSIGQTVILVEFKKGEAKEGEEPKWENSFSRVDLISIYNFDPMTMTYDCKYKYVDGDDKEEKEMKIIPEGFSWGNPEETGEMKRLVPLSMHFQMMEDEAFLVRVKDLFESRETLAFEYLMNLTKSKEQASLLKYANNVGAAVKLNDGEILWIRFHEVSLYHKNGTKYALRFANNDRSWSMIIDSADKEFDFEGVGKFKIINLSD